MTTSPPHRRNHYLGLGLVALTTLAVQIALTRLMSYVTWYHLAFFAISTCMLGMTAGAVRVYLRPDPSPEGISRDCFRFGLSTVFTVAFLCHVPIQIFDSHFTFAPILLGATLIATAPFYFAGAVVAQVLAAPGLPAGRLYASDLVGAALGCIVVLVAMTTIDVPSLIVLLAGVAVLCGVIFHPAAKTAKWAGAALVAAALLNAALPEPLFRANFTKGSPVASAGTQALSKWNSFSHIAISKPGSNPPVFWGKSPVAPDFGNKEWSWFVIDGLAGTPMSKFESRADIEFMEHDVTNMAHFIRPRGHAAVIGVGGGRDVQSALLFGHEQVTAVEVNTIIVDAHERLFRDYAKIAGNPAVKLVLDDGRSYMARTGERFTVLQMSLVDTWAATGAGAFSLSENGLYTVEAWRMFVSRLTEDGVFTVSRWHNPENLGETGRVVSVAMKAMFDLGAADPSRHLAMITSNNISTLIMSRSPLTDRDTGTLARVAAEKQFEVAFLPGIPPANPLLRDLLASKTPDLLMKVAAAPHTPFNVLPSTDDSPFFFNMLKPGAVFDSLALSSTGGLNSSTTGIVAGNLHAEYTLLVLIGVSLLLAVLTTVIPLFVARRTEALRQPGFLPSAVLFSMIGLAFMFVEIGMMQRLSGFLGHPVYSLAILLFSLILSTGIGSFASDRLSSAAIRRLAFAIVPMTIALPFLLASIIEAMETSGMPLRIAASIAFTIPFGLVMGIFFPSGLRLTREMGFTDTAWFWSLNGVFGTVASGVAVYVSIHFGITTTLLCAAACYFVAAVAMSSMRPAKS